MKKFIASDYIDFWIKYNNLIDEQKIFYETILEGKQKPRFDLELEYENKDFEFAKRYFIEIYTQVLAGIKIEMQTKEQNYAFESNCLIFSSHGANKFSMHIIINKFYHHNSKEAKAFYNAVIQYVSDHLKSYGKTAYTIDPLVYKSNQQFSSLWDFDYMMS